MVSLIIGERFYYVQDFLHKEVKFHLFQLRFLISIERFQIHCGGGKCVEPRPLGG